jgi:hypothetical protein
MKTQPNRPWRELAAEASREQDPKKLLDLTRRLLDAYDEQQGMQRKEESKRRNRPSFFVAL